MASPVTRHLTILLTDIKGFTDKTSKKSRADIQRLLDDHREVVLPVLQGRGGKLVYKVRRETPLGVGQVPAKAAPAKASGFAPGEKARLVSVSDAAPAATLPAPDRELLKLRARAIVVDFFLVALLAPSLAAIVGDIFPAASRDRGAVSVKADSGGATVRADGKTVRFDENGITESPDDDAPRRHGRRFSATSIVWVLFGGLCLWRFGGTTPGKRLMGLKVVSEDGSPVDAQKAFLRAATSLVSWYALVIGYLWASKDPQGRTWHDLIAGTRVVRAEPSRGS